MNPAVEALRALREKLTTDGDPSGYFRELVDTEIARHESAESTPRPLANVAQDGAGWAPMTYHVWLDLPCHDVAPVKAGMRRADADGLASAINARARDELRDRLAKLEAAAQRAYEFYACECECDKCECECAGCTISRELGALLKKETA